MRNFHRRPEAGGAKGKAITSSQDMPLNVISLSPNGGSVSRATPDINEPVGPGEFAYRQPVTSVKGAQLRKAGKP